ncbi:MAG: pyrroline-5-carboxylate reductase family protein [Candidatus Methylomirabilales bacterium]
MSILTGKRFGFLGAGVIAEVSVRRLLGSRLAKAEEILAYDIKEAILERLAVTFEVRPMKSNSDVAANADYIFLAVPPLAIVPVLREVAPALRIDQMILSLAAAVSTELMEAAIGKPVPVVRLIPNTPFWIGQGMNPYCLGSHVGPGEAEEAWELLKVFGKAEEIPEEQMAIATALTAVGPTYIFPVIAALADAAIAHDLPPHIALPAACQVVAGAAALVTQTERSPNSLSLMIGTRTLDEGAARKLFTQAVEDAHAKIMATEAKVTAGAAAKS